MILAWVIPLTILVVIFIIFAACLLKNPGRKFADDIENCEPPNYSDAVKYDPPSYIDILRENKPVAVIT